MEEIVETLTPGEIQFELLEPILLDKGFVRESNWNDIYKSLIFNDEDDLRLIGYETEYCHLNVMLRATDIRLTFHLLYQNLHNVSIFGTLVINVLLQCTETSVKVTEKTLENNTNLPLEELFRDLRLTKFVNDLLIDASKVLNFI